MILGFMSDRGTQITGRIVFHFPPCPVDTCSDACGRDTLHRCPRDGIVSEQVRRLEAICDMPEKNQIYNFYSFYFKLYTKGCCLQNS